MREAQNILDVEKVGTQWMGFIFYPQSPRFVSEVPAYLPKDAKRVGVFVNETKRKILETASRFGLDLLQLHGSESPDFCDEMGKTGLKIIKAFSIDNYFPSEFVKNYHTVCHYFLFDTKTAAYGGSGKKFNWEILSDYQGTTPFLLSGGISPEGVEEVQNFSHPQCIGLDINSKFEIKPGLKNVEAVKEFIQLVTRNP